MDAAGHATLVVRLADGTLLTLSSYVDEADQLDFYSPLYATKGSLSGRLHFDDNDHANGALLWAKPNAFSGEGAASAAR